MVWLVVSVGQTATAQVNAAFKDVASQSKQRADPVKATWSAQRGYVLGFPTSTAVCAWTPPQRIPVKRRMMTRVEAPGPVLRDFARIFSFQVDQYVLTIQTVYLVTVHGPKPTQKEGVDRESIAHVRRS